MIRQQCEILERELACAQDHARQQSVRIQCLEKEKIELSSRAEQDVICTKLEATDNAMKLMKEKGDLELQCRQLKANLAGTDRSEMIPMYGQIAIGSRIVQSGGEPVRRSGGSVAVC